ncbi:hypothetical protein BLS_009840 [Venturia inaequalis]|uniref:Uncharacterized protein n=1 Tax=Venturia inaequalis TaxID=5025 RepID=A0A8H3YZC5_VENIN|nr:hypothetical protein BLS_009840 [Venturia inaequalis]
MATVDCPRTGQSDSIGRWLGAALTPEQNSNKVINKCETVQKSLSDKSCFHATPSSLREAEHSRHHSDKPAMADHDRFVSPDQPHVPLDNSLPLVLFYDLTLSPHADSAPDCMDSNLTLFRGRRYVPSSTTLSPALNPPVPIPPPPPPEAETNPASMTTVMRSMLPETTTTTNKDPPPASAPAPTQPPDAPAALVPKPAIPGPAPAASSAEEETIQPSVSVKSVMESSVTNTAPTPIAPPPVIVAPTPAPAASNKPDSPPAPLSDPKPKETPKAGGQAPAASGQSPPPAAPDPGAAPQPLPAASPSPNGGTNQNTPPVVGGSPAATNSPNSGSSQLQPQSNGNSPAANPSETGVVPLPTMITSGSVVRPQPTVVVSTGKGGSLTSFTITPTLPKSAVGNSVAGGKSSSGAMSTHDPSVPHADGSAHTPGDTHAQQEKKVDVGAIGGAIAAVFGVALIAFLIVFCGKRAKRKKRGSGTPLLRNAGTKSSMKEKVTAMVSSARSSNPVATPVAGERRSVREKVTSLFSAKGLFGGDQAAAPVARSTTPALERGMREVSTSDVPRNRASSEPPQTIKEKALGPLAMIGRRSPNRHEKERQLRTNETPTRIPTPVAQHRRSASSVSSIIQSWTATGEENNPFRDPDSARPLRLLNPDLSRSNTANTIGTIRQPLAPLSMPPNLISNIYPPALLISSPPPFGPLPSRPQHKRSFSQSRVHNPFLDPEPQQDPSRSRSQTPTEYMATGHSRTTSLRRNQFERSVGSLMHQNSTSTFDSGFVSATVSPQVRQGGFAGNDKPSFRVDYDATPYGLSTVPASRSASGSSQGSFSISPSSITPSELLRELDAFESPFSDSHRSSKSISFDYGSESLVSEAGPTRPTTSAFPSYLLDENRRMSRASDPFDLDRPEILGLMKLGLTNSRDTSLSRSESGNSIRSERSGTRGKRKSQGKAWILNSESVREI